MKETEYLLRINRFQFGLQSDIFLFQLRLGSRQDVNLQLGLLKVGVEIRALFRHFINRLIHLTKRSRQASTVDPLFKKTTVKNNIHKKHAQR